MANTSGRVLGVNGNMVTVEFDSAISKNEVGYIHVGDDRLKGEVIRINGNTASLQVFEMTNGIRVGDVVEFSQEMLSVTLGPGLLQQIYDGLQNPLPELASQCGFFLQRGVYLDPIPNNSWEFTPTVAVGAQLRVGDTFGTVPEGLFTHQIMVPFTFADTS
ncbi:MAG: V-type ATP synthase subunit A, partial [Spirochaetales bacterium]|nr:V-type ATP synthase subunit A [Spirochaetales bacterium]